MQRPGGERSRVDSRLLLGSGELEDVIRTVRRSAQAGVKSRELSRDGLPRVVRARGVVVAQQLEVRRVSGKLNIQRDRTTRDGRVVACGCQLDGRRIHDDGEVLGTACEIGLSRFVSDVLIHPAVGGFDQLVGPQVHSAAGCVRDDVVGQDCRPEGRVKEVGRPQIDRARRREIPVQHTIECLDVDVRR